MSKTLAPESQTSHDDSKENPEGIENFEPFEKEQDQHLNTINCFFLNYLWLKKKMNLELFLMYNTLTILEVNGKLHINLLNHLPLPMKEKQRHKRKPSFLKLNIVGLMI